MPAAILANVSHRERHLHETQRSQCAPWPHHRGYQRRTTAHIKLELAPGLTMFSSITNEAVDDLDLKVGDSAWAVIKSSDVMIGK